MSFVHLNSTEEKAVEPDRTVNIQGVIAVIGASGELGTKFCTIAHLNALKTICFVRHESNVSDFCVSPNHMYEIHRIEFDDIQHEITPEKLEGVMAAVSFLGTNLDQGKEKHAIAKKEYEYNTKFARICRENSIQMFIFCSTHDAYFSTTCYSKTKQQIENFIRTLKFPKVLFLQPKPAKMIERYTKNKLKHAYEKHIQSLAPKQNANAPISIIVSALDYIFNVSKFGVSVYQADDINQRASKYSRSDLYSTRSVIRNYANRVKAAARSQ